MSDEQDEHDEHDDTARTIEQAKPFSEKAKAFGRDVAGAIRSIERDDLPNGGGDDDD